MKISPADLYALVMEIEGVLWGDHVTRNNGLRSTVKRHEERLDATEKIACEAHDKLETHLEAHAKMSTATKELRIAIAVAVVSSIGSILMGLAAVLKIIQEAPK